MHALTELLIHSCFLNGVENELSCTEISRKSRVEFVDLGGHETLSRTPDIVSYITARTKA